MADQESNPQEPTVEEQTVESAVIETTTDEITNDAGAGTSGENVVAVEPVEQPQSFEPECGPSSITGVGPPSPLTGCYLLIVIGEPHSSEHKDIILQRLVKGLLSWDVSDCHVDLEDELSNLSSQSIEGEEGKHGERLIQFASENLVTEILIHPQFNTFIQCIRNLLSSFTRHRHIIHAGYTFAGNGSWILQDGTFSVSDFAEAFQDYEVQRVLRAYPDTITMDIHCSGNGLWSTIPDKNYAKACKIRINPVDVLDSGSEKLNAFIDYLSPMLAPTEITDLLESSDVVGNIRFSHPTLYVFPGGQGDAALFGINGFNMLVDGGFSRKSCFWDFVRHLDRLDAVLMTRINNSNISGLNSVIERKAIAHVYPQIGHFFSNIPDRRGLPSPDGDKDKDPLLIDLIEEGHKTITNLKTLNLKAQHCYRDSEPMNLYHKVGHGTLDMYVISPSKDSKEVKDFIQKWNNSDPKLFATKDSKEFIFPLQNMISICALLIWTPANPEDNVTRILFPGSTPQAKIFEGLDKIKSLEFLKTPVCTVKSLSTSTSSVTITKKVYKSAGLSEKIQSDSVLQSKPISKPIEKDNKAMEIDNKVTESKSTEVTKEEIKEIVQETKKEQQVLKSMASKSKTVKAKSESKRIENKVIKKIDPKDSDAESQEEKKSDEDTKVEAKSEKESPTEPKKDEIDSKMSKARMSRPKTDSRVVARSRIDTKPPKALTERKIIKKDVTDAKEPVRSSPTTPKKTATKSTEDTKLSNGSVVREKVEVKKTITRTIKASPKGTPAKSTKEANNRKVLESSQKAPVVKREVAKQTKTERKPLSHRTKAASPGRKIGASPSKKPIKTEKDAVIRKSRIDKNGTTDSSLVSTPSADEAAKRVIEPSDSEAKPEDLEELKEEQEAVREIEAVFEKDQGKVEKKELAEDHREIQEADTEAEEEEEYLIIEKEEPYTEDSINEAESSATKEEEIQKLQRDSEESEKRRKGSLEVTEEENEQEISDHQEEKDDGKSEKDQLQQDDEAKQITTDVDEQEDVEQAVENQEPTSEVEKDTQQPVDDIKEQLQEEVHEIISSAKEIAKTKLEAPENKTDESSATPEEKVASKKTSEKDEENQNDGDGQQQAVSQPEEKFSANAESGATTTAPTLPEDERCPLDEIKEDIVIEEKHVKEDTKESEVPSNVLQRVFEPLERQSPPRLPIESTVAPHLRDIVKTPDEVADLPVHEEADMGVYDDGRKSTEKELQAKDKETEKELDKTEIKSDKPESDKICDDEDVSTKKEAVIEQIETIKDIDFKESAKENIDEALKLSATATPEQDDIKDTEEKITESPQATSRKESVVDETSPENQEEKSPKVSNAASPDPEVKKLEQQENKPTSPIAVSRKSSIADKSQPTSRKASTAAVEKSPPASRNESLVSSRKSSLAKEEKDSNKIPSPEKSLPGSRKSSLFKADSKPPSPDKSKPTSRKSSLNKDEQSGSKAGSRKPSISSKPESPVELKHDSRKSSIGEEAKQEPVQLVADETAQNIPLNDDILTSAVTDSEEPKLSEEAVSPNIPATPTTTPIEKAASTESTDKNTPEQVSKEPSKASSPNPSEETVETQIEELKIDTEIEKIIEKDTTDDQETEYETVQVISEIKDGISTVIGLQEIQKSKDSSRAITPEINESIKAPTADKDISEPEKESSEIISKKEDIEGDENVTQSSEQEKEINEEEKGDILDSKEMGEPTSPIQTTKEESKPSSPIQETIKEDQVIEVDTVKIISEVKDGIATVVGVQQVAKSKESSKAVTPEPDIDEKEKLDSPIAEINQSKEASKPTSPIQDTQDEEVIETVKIISEVKEGIATVIGQQEITKSKDSSKAVTPEPKVEEKEIADSVIEELKEDTKTVSPIEQLNEEGESESPVQKPNIELKQESSIQESKEEAKVESSIQDTKEESKPESPILESKEASKPESPILESKEASKPESPVHDSKEEVKVESSIQDTKKASKPESPILESKEASKPESPILESKEASKPESPILESKEASKPESPVHDSKEEVKVESSIQDTKEASKPESPILESKEASKPGSPILESKEASKPESSIPESKEASKPESPVHESKEASKPESPVQESKEEIKVETSIPESKEASKPESPVHESKEDVKEESPIQESKEASKPESPIQESKEASKPESPILESKEEVKVESPIAESKEASKPESPVPDTKEASKPESPIHESKDVVETETVKIISEIKEGIATVAGLQEIPKSKESSKAVTPEPEMHPEQSPSVEIETEIETLQKKLTTQSIESSKIVTPEADRADSDVKLEEIDGQPTDQVETEQNESSTADVVKEESPSKVDSKSKESSKAVTPKPQQETNKLDDIETEVVKIISDVKDGIPVVSGIHTIQHSKESSKAVSPEPESQKEEKSISKEKETGEIEKDLDLKESASPTTVQEISNVEQTSSSVVEQKLSKESSKAASPEPKDNEKKTTQDETIHKSGSETKQIIEEAELEETVKIISEIKDGVATILGVTKSGSGSKASSGVPSRSKSPDVVDESTEVKANGEAIKMSEETTMSEATEKVEDLVESIKSSALHAVDFTKEDIKQIETEMKEVGEKIIETVKTEVASKIASVEGDSKIFKDEMQKVVDDADKAVNDLVETVNAEIKASTNLINEQAESLETIATQNISTIKSEAQTSIDKVRQDLSDTRHEIEDLTKQTSAAAEQLKLDIAAEVQKTMDSLQDSAKDEITEIQSQVETKVTSLLGGLTKHLSEGIEKVTTTIETTITSKLEDIEKKIDTVTHEVDDIEPQIIPTIMKEVTTELRETHITTVDSPVKEVKVQSNLEDEHELMNSSFRIEEIKYDTGLDEIKEVEEEDRCSPPKLSTSSYPLRPRTPEEVQKIVAEVAEVLKSDKDIHEIIPDFDEKELERRLSSKSDDTGSVHRMLVTASSEDGGGETEICPHDTMIFDRSRSPDLSGKSSPEIKVDLAPDIDQNDAQDDVIEDIISPDQKASPSSIEEKDKHEVSEKCLTKQDIVTSSKTDVERKESVAELIEPDRRESTFSTFSEKDMTRDETSIEEQKSQESRSQSVASHISDIKDEGHEVPSHDSKAQSESGSIGEKSPTKSLSGEKEDEKSPFSGIEMDQSKFPSSTIDEEEMHSDYLKHVNQTSDIPEAKLIQEAPDKFPVTAETFDQELQKHDETKGGFPIRTIEYDDQTPDTPSESRKGSEQIDAKPFDAQQNIESPEEPIVLKESRSKSVSAIVIKTPYKLEKEFLDDTRKLPALAESISSSHESLHRSSISIDAKARDSVDLTKFPISEEIKEESVLTTTTKTVIETVTEKHESSTPEPDVSGKHSPDVTSKSVDISSEKGKSSSEKSSGTLEKDSIDGSLTTGNTTIEKDSLSLDSSKLGDKVETIVTQTTHTTTTVIKTEEKSVPEISTSTTETTSSTEEVTGRKTPPTAPVSPNIKTEATQKESIEELRKESLQSAVSSIHGSTESVARSIPMSIGGQESGIETPESSPKPTAPFPKGLDAVKSEEMKTTSGMSTPDMTRTSTPDEITHIESVDGSKTITKTIVTTVTTVITKDGERVVSEKTTTETSSDVEDTPEKVQKLTSTVHTSPYEYQSITIHKSSASDHSQGHESEDEGACSAMSTSPQPPASPYTSKFTFETEYESQRTSNESKKLEIDDNDEIPPQYDSAITLGSSTFKSDPMSTSFYGSLPGDESLPLEGAHSTFTTQFVETVSSPIEVAEFRRKSSDKYFDEADLDFDKVMTTSETQSKEQESQKEKKQEDDKEKKTDETLAAWGKPLGLPSPALTPAEPDNRTTPKKERKQVAAKTKLNNEKNLRKRGESPASKKRSPPVYVDLAYVPHHGNSYYSHVEFFRRIRARYYVFSGTEPSREVYNALLEAKQTWEDKELEVTIIPTYDTDVLGYWVSENEELLTKYHIDLSPSAARCTINLQDHETSCSAYRLEF